MIHDRPAPPTFTLGSRLPGRARGGSGPSRCAPACDTDLVAALAQFTQLAPPAADGHGNPRRSRMSGVSGVSDRQRSTEQMMDEVAHDARLVGSKEHVHSGGTQESAAKAWSSRHDKALASDGKAVAKEGAVAAFEELFGEALEHGYVAGGAAAAGPLVAFGSLMQWRFLVEEGWLKPHLEGDHVRELQTNDALNVGVADALALPPAFKKSVHDARPGVEKGAEKVRIALAGKDAAMVPVLQARADEGYLAAQRLASDVASLPPDQRKKAIEDGMKKLVERGSHDVAFGLGLHLFTWSQAQDAATRAKVDADVHARVAPRPFHTQG
jgi:hypothetical protein